MQTTEQTTQAQARLLEPLTRRLCERVRHFDDECPPWVRGLAATRVYRDMPDLPRVLQVAEVIAQWCERLEPIALPEERIVGPAYRRFMSHGSIHRQHGWRNSAYQPERFGYRDDLPVPGHVRNELKWWADHHVPGIPNPVRAANPWLGLYAIARPHGRSGGHSMPDYGIVLRKGIPGLRRELAQRRRRGDTTESQNLELRAMARCLEGLATLCLRCARAARATGCQTQEPELKARMRTAAANCENLTHRAPASLHEALQLLYLATIVSPGSHGRADQYLYPFYAADTRAGLLSEADAFDLVCHFLAKRWRIQDPKTITVGGVDRAGNDATNALSYMFPEAMESTGLCIAMSVRLHNGTPPGFLRTVLRVVRRGFGYPSLFNDEITIPSLVAHGTALEDARDYAPLGCVEVMIPGRCAHRTMCMGLNLPKILELTLNRGRCLVTNDTVWDDVPGAFDDFDALLCEYHKRVEQVIALGCDIVREDERLEPAYSPLPHLTLLAHGAVEKAIDLAGGLTAYDPVGVTLKGIADIANSLYAVKRLVYDERRLSIEQLRAVLAADWQDHEPLRQRVINRFPRFGQDEPDVDAFAAQEAAFYAACFEHERTYYGGHFWPMIFGVTTGLISIGKKVGAMPAGRRTADMLAQSLQPSTAGPQGCTTAMMKSLAAVDYHDYPGGVSNVQEVDPVLVEGEQGLERLCELVAGFFDDGGMELSLNLLNEQTLRTAQKQPDAYGHLHVRVFGMSAQFVGLSPELQEVVIQRVAAAHRRVSGEKSEIGSRKSEVGT